MNLFINSEQIISNSTNLYKILEEHLFTSKKGIAVALNNSVVSKPNWTKTELKENDKILIITATQGG